MLVVSMKQKYFVHYHIVGYVRFGERGGGGGEAHKKNP